jgi:hypothetical protein
MARGNDDAKQMKMTVDYDRLVDEKKTTVKSSDGRRDIEAKPNFEECIFKGWHALSLNCAQRPQNQNRKNSLCLFYQEGFLAENLCTSSRSDLAWRLQRRFG